MGMHFDCNCIAVASLELPFSAAVSLEVLLAHA
jgi:hypothetical protein